MVFGRSLEMSQTRGISGADPASVLESIGGTPLIALSREGVEIYAKGEHMNPGAR